MEPELISSEPKPMSVFQLFRSTFGSSAIMEWNLVCDDLWMRATAQVRLWHCDADASSS